MIEIRQAGISETFSKNKDYTKGKGVNNMKRKKLWKNKKISSFAASAILVIGLLPLERIVHAEEGAVSFIQSSEENPVQKDKEKSKEDAKPPEEQKQEDRKSQEKLRGSMQIETPTDSLQQAEAEPHAGLIGYYFRNESFKDLSYISESKTGYLTSELEEDVKSIYWHGYIHAETEGEYRFQTTDNENAIITVNGERVLNQSNESKKIQLETGKKYEIDIQYVRKENQEAFQLYWTKYRPDSENTEFAEVISSHFLTVPNIKVEKNPSKAKVMAYAAPTNIDGHKVKITGVEYEDTDGDGIPDEWEVNGYTVVWEEKNKIKKSKIVAWNDEIHKGKNDLFGKPYIKYVSDPDHKSTTRDPYSDYDKVMNKKIVDSSVLDIAKHPLVAALPAIQIEVEDFSVGIADTITSTTDSKNINMKSKANQSGSTTTNGWFISGQVGLEGDKTGPKASIGINGGYNSSTTTVNTMETLDLKQDEQGWAKSIGYNAGARAYAYGAVRYNNVGTAPAYNTTPTVTMGLPISAEYTEYSKIHDMIATLSAEVNQGQGAIALKPHSTYPARDKFPVFFSNFSNFRPGSIELLESQFKRFEKQKQLQFDLVKWGADVTLGDKKPSEGNNWNHYISQSEHVTARLLYEMPTNQSAQGNQPVKKNPSVEVLERKVIGKPKNPHNGPNRPSLNIRDAIELTSDLKIEKDGYRYGNYTFKDITIAFDTDSSPSVEKKLKTGSLHSFKDLIIEEGMQIKIVPKGWVKSEHVTYYYGDDGKLATGVHKIKDPDTTVERAYYFDKDGKLSTYKGKQKIDGKTYYFGEKGDGTGLTEGEPATDFRTIKDSQGKANKYYFGKSGDGTKLEGTKLAEGEMATEWFQIGADWYRAEKDGKLNIGTLDWGSDTYFFDEIGKHLFSIKKCGDKYYGYGPGNKKPLHDFQTINGRVYYFGKSGDGTKLAEGQMATNFQTIKDAQRKERMYYFGESGDGTKLAEGQMATGLQTIGSDKFYLGQKGDGTGLEEGQMAANRFVKVGKDLYYTQAGGYIVTGKWFQVGADWYRAEKDGKLNVGTLDWGSDTYFFDEIGKHLFSIKKCGGKYYGYGPGDNTFITLYGFKIIDGKKRYFGLLETRDSASGQTFVTESDGTGLSNGQMAINQWLNVKRYWYYAGAEGKMLTGLQTIGSDKFYLGQKGDGTGLEEGQMAANRFVKVGKDLYYTQAGGHIVTDKWFQVGTEWYRAEKDGKLNVGTLDWGSDKYFFDKTTGKSLFSIRKKSRNYYGYGPGGTNATFITGEHITSDNKRYYFVESGGSKGYMSPMYAIKGDYYIQTIESGVIRDKTTLVKMGTSTQKVKTTLHSPVLDSSSRIEKFSNTNNLATSFVLTFDKDGAIIPTKHSGQKFINWYKVQHTGEDENHPNMEIFEAADDENGFYKDENIGKSFYFAEEDDEKHDMKKVTW